MPIGTKKTKQEREEIVLRLCEIKEEIKLLVSEAYRLVRDTPAFGRAKAYWYAHIIMALDKDHEYLGGSMTTLEDTIDELENPEEERSDR